MAEERWYFSKEQLMNSPSRQCGLDQSQESLQRQQAANLIQDMGQKLLVSQLCINTAIVYMHRFYAFHSFTLFHRNQMAAASLFLAAKVEEQPRKLEHVIKAMKWCINRDTPPIDPKTKEAVNQMDDLAFNENILLQTLGFDVAIDHPHTHVVKTCHLIRAPKELTQTSYFMASNSLHKTTMCLQYKPSIVACFCIHVACKWSNWQIPQSKEGKHWYEYVDPSVTGELLDQLTLDFLHHFDRNRAKTKLMTLEMPLGPADNMPHKEPRRSEQSSRHSAAPGTVVDHKHRPSSSRQHSHSQSQSQSNSYSNQSSGNQPGSSQNRSSSQGTHQSTHQVRNNDINVMQQHNASATVHNHHKSSQNNSGSHQSHSLNPNASIPYDNQPLSYPNVPPREYRDQNKRAEERALMNANKSYPQTQEQVGEHRSSSSNMKRVSSADTTSQQKHRLHNQIPSQNTSHPITNKDQSHYPTGSTRDRQGYYNQSESEHRMYNETSRDNRPDVMKFQKQEHKSRPSTSNSSSDNKDGNNSNMSKPFSNKQSIGSHEQRGKTLAPLFSEPKVTVSNSYSFDEPNRSEFVRTPPKQLTKIASLFSPDGIDPPTTLIKKQKHESKSIVHKKHSPKDKRDRKPEVIKKSDRKSQEINIVKSEKLAHIKTETNVPGASSQPSIPSTSFVPSPGDKYKQKTSKNKSRMIESNAASTAELVEDRLFGDCSSSASSSIKTESIKMEHPSSDISSYGIETNPDMISSLLKDSLFNTAEQSQFDYSSFSLPDQPVSPSPESIFNEPLTANDTLTVEPHIDSVQAAPIDSNLSNSSDHKSKSEKKKKKEKHKHKDKDRDRSRDERKKHKKDKDRHKDRKDDGGSIPAGPLKITIPKDKINLEMSEPSLKIKIPKDRLTSVPSNESKVALKIKIPKEVIEYNKKRDRDRSSDKGPPSKSYKLA